MKLKNKTGSSAGRASVLAVAAGALSACAGYPEPAADHYSAAYYTGATRLYEADKVAAFRASPQRDAEGRVMPVVEYAGIEGARRAHQEFDVVNAEKLDGKCQRFVRVGTGENLIDIADLCDVAVGDLVDFNPAMSDPYLVEVGQIVEIPFVDTRNNGTLVGFADEMSDLYTVRQGDSLSEIAYRFNVSTASIANLNPNVSWSTLQEGDRLRLPTAGGPGAPAAPAQAYAPAAGWEGYDATGVGVGEDISPLRQEVVSVMPYNLGPVQAEAAFNARDPEPGIALSRRVAKPGQSVQVKVTSKPNADVTIYRGDNVQEMEAVGTVRTDDEGRAETSVRIRPSRDNAGGVVFKAEPEGGEAIYSERVGVIKLKEPTDYIADAAMKAKEEADARAAAELAGVTYEDYVAAQEEARRLAEEE